MQTEISNIKAHAEAQGYRVIFRPGGQITLEDKSGLFVLFQSYAALERFLARADSF
jgi:hypothetical protein